MINVLYRISLIVLLSTLLCSCVEVREKSKDKEQAESLVIAPMVEPQEVTRLVLDAPAFIYQGRIINEREMNIELVMNKENISRKSEDFEFHFDEVVLKKGAILYTLGNKVRLHIDHFESDEASIATFPENTKALPGTEGRSGGHLLLDLKNPKGHLTLWMRGEEGASGTEGAAPDEKLRGATGAAGTSTTCQKYGTKLGKNGEPGGKGLRGYPGNPGFRGGDSGTLDLIIQSGDEFFYKVERVSGQGGLGGKGGAGGAGGQGGAAGGKNGDIAALSCFGTIAGGAGAQGDSGFPGADGVNGDISTICITKNQSMSCY